MTQKLGLAQALSIQQRRWATLAYDSTQINDTANNVTVRIDINNGQDHGSGVVIARTDSAYYVLTSNHVVAAPDFKYEIVTPDGEKHLADASTIRSIADIKVDLAIISFNSDRSYKIAQIENTADRIGQGTPIYINGFPEAGRQVKAGPQFTPGIITGTNEGHCSGYNLVYNNVTKKGMSGGPIFNEQGKVVGIHGLAEQERLEGDVNGCQANTVSNETREKVDFNLGISIATFVKYADKLGMTEVLDSTSTDRPRRPTTVPNDPNADAGCSGTDC